LQILRLLLFHYIYKLISSKFYKKNF
jgi:hypothetical protein